MEVEEFFQVLNDVIFVKICEVLKFVLCHEDLENKVRILNSFLLLFEKENIHVHMYVQ